MAQKSEKASFVTARELMAGAPSGRFVADAEGRLVESSREPLDMRRLVFEGAHRRVEDAHRRVMNEESDEGDAHERDAHERVDKQEAHERVEREVHERVDKRVAHERVE